MGHPRWSLFVSLIAIIALHGCSASTRHSDADSTERYAVFEFPVSVAGLTRHGFERFPDPDAGVGAGYSLESESGLLISVFAYPSPRTEAGSISTLEEQFPAERQLVASQWNEARLVPWPSRVRLPLRLGVRGAHQAFEVANADGLVLHSLLSIEDYGEHRLKFRISYHPARETAERQISDFLEAFPHPVPQTPHNRQ